MITLIFVVFILHRLVMFLLLIFKCLLGTELAIGFLILGATIRPGVELA
jgi:hypothetical protein